MSRAFKARSGVAYHAKRDHIVAIDGSKHTFKVGDKKARKAAVEAAQSAGDQHLATMREQKGGAGAELSKQEKLTGQHDTPASEPRGPQSLKKDPGEKRNPYRVAADSEASRPAHSPDELGRRNTRVAHFARLADQYEQQEAAKEVQSAHWEDPATQAMVEHANGLLESVSRDPQSTPAQVGAAKHLHTLATSTILSPASYHAMVASSGLTKPLPTAGKKVGIAQPLAEMMGDGLAVQPQAGDA